MLAWERMSIWSGKYSVSLAGRQDHLLVTEEFMLCVGGRARGLLKVFFHRRVLDTGLLLRRSWSHLSPHL